MAKIIFSFSSGKGLIFESSDSDIENIMLSLIRQGTISSNGYEPQKQVLSQPMSKQAQYKECIRAMPTHAKIHKFIISQPDYKFNRRSLEAHLFAGGELDKIKEIIGRKYHERMNSSLKYARDVIEKLEHGTWVEVEREGNLKTWRFEKKTGV